MSPKATARAVAQGRQRDPRAGRLPSRPASPRRSNGPMPRRSWKRAAAPGRKRSAARIGVLIKDEEDLPYLAPRAPAHPRGGARMTLPCRCRGRTLARLRAAAARSMGFAVAPEQTVAFLERSAFSARAPWTDIREAAACHARTADPTAATNSRPCSAPGSRATLAAARTAKATRKRRSRTTAAEARSRCLPEEQARRRTGVVRRSSSRRARFRHGDTST